MTNDHSFVSKYCRYEHHDEIAEGGCQEQVKVSQIFLPDAFPDPGAVVVVADYADIAIHAVHCLQRPHYLARLAEPRVATHLLVRLFGTRSQPRNRKAYVEIRQQEERAADDDDDSPDQSDLLGDFRNEEVHDSDANSERSEEYPIYSTL